MYLVIGIVLGIVTGVINFFIFEKQMKEFLANKKWHLIIAGYIVRYVLIGFVLYFSIKKGKPLFIGTLLGFFAAQVVFFSKKARAMKSTA